MCTNSRRPSYVDKQVKSSETDATYHWVIESHIFVLYILNNPTQVILARLGLGNGLTSLVPKRRSEATVNNCTLVCHYRKSAQSTGYRGGTISIPLGQSFKNHTTRPLYELLGTSLSII